MTQEMKLVLELARRADEALKAARLRNPQYGWGEDRLIHNTVLRYVVRYGTIATYAGLVPADSLDVLCREAALAAGGHSFTSKKSGISYPASRPDVVALYNCLAQICKTAVKGIGDPNLLYDLQEWDRQETLIGVFTD